jgi:hypothetical protein
MVGMMEWLRQYPPQDVDKLTMINHAELCQYDQPQTIEIATASQSNGHLNEFDQDTQSLAVADSSSFDGNTHLVSFSMDCDTDYSQVFSSSSEEISPPLQTRSANGYNDTQAFQGKEISPPIDGLSMNGYNDTQALHGNYSAMTENALNATFGMNANFAAFAPQSQDLSLQYPFSTTDVSQVAAAAYKQDLASAYRNSPIPSGALAPRFTTPLSHPYPVRTGQSKLHFLKKLDQWEDITTWNAQELADNRRIIKFTKYVRRDMIILDSEVIPVSEWKEDMISISCIRWAPSPPNEIQHKLAGRCVFTSVDIIMLMERLVEYTFLVQEKNRIRRNLEGFKPETVKKEGNTQRFFNQVMNYNQPKTRNIEKDIKVFAWSDIGRALKKIMAKYHRHEGVKLGKHNPEPPQQPATIMSAPFPQGWGQGQWETDLGASAGASTYSLPTAM